MFPLFSNQHTMSRSKKSRKPGVGSSGIVKDDKKKVVIAADKKPKKKTGKKPGNRQQEAVAKQTQKNQNAENRDPRIGSKKPIELVPATSKKPLKSNQSIKPAKTNDSPIAAIRVVEPLADHAALEQELYAIEDDAKLQAILAKQEDDIALSETEVDFFNETMERHQEIRHILGWHDDDEDETVEEEIDGSDDEESLWDKLDNNDLSSFEKE